MDGKSAALISAICVMLCISTSVVYVTWFAEKGHTAASVEMQIQEEMALAQIAMNQDSQVINGGCQDMWIRAKICRGGAEQEYAEAAKKENRGTDVSCRLISENIVNEATEAEKNAGVWISGEDGYYYYSKPVPPGGQSNPLFQSVRGQVGVRVEAEAVQVNWIGQDIQDGKEAFRQFSLHRLQKEYSGAIV